MALTAAALADPTLALVAKTDQGRTLIRAAVWLDGADRHPAINGARELFVAGPWPEESRHGLETPRMSPE